MTGRGGRGGRATDRRFNSAPPRGGFGRPPQQREQRQEDGRGERYCYTIDQDLIAL